MVRGMKVQNDIVDLFSRSVVKLTVSHNFKCFVADNHCVVYQAYFI